MEMVRLYSMKALSTALKLFVSLLAVLCLCLVAIALLPTTLVFRLLVIVGLTPQDKLSIFLSEGVMHIISWLSHFQKALLGSE